MASRDASFARMRDGASTRRASSGRRRECLWALAFLAAGLLVATRGDAPGGRRGCRLRGHRGRRRNLLALEHLLELLALDRLLGDQLLDDLVELRTVRA